MKSGPTLALLLCFTLACGPKKSPTPAVSGDTPNAPAESVPTTTPVLEPEPEPEPALVPNADFQATLSFADGSTKSGHVVRIERGEDFFADKGWTDRASRLTLGLEQGDEAIDADWSSVKTIDIRYARTTDIDCLYDSTFNPWMYMCVLKSSPSIRTTDGKSWTSTSRHKWKFTFEDESTVEFYVYKLPNRIQDDKEVEFGGAESQNFALYKQLQDGLVEILKTTAIKRISLSPSSPE
jgi:hypothetical protein